jgi:hypothetical protein
MGSDPLLLMVGNWTLEVKINDLGCEVMLHTDSNPRTTHFVRLDRKQSRLLLDYLDRNMGL